MEGQLRIVQLIILLVGAMLAVGCANVAPPPVTDVATLESAVTTAPPAPTPVGGLRCEFAGTGATLAFEGERLNFTCGGEADRIVGLLGDISAAEAGWVIRKATIADTDDGFALEASELVPVSYIELADGTGCAFAGTGSTLAFEGERLNFACSRDADSVVVLLGDVTLTEEGWAIRRGTIVTDEGGASLESSELATIAALIVNDVDG